MSFNCKICGSYAINHHNHGRDGSDPDLCDVCFWETRAKELAEQARIAGEMIRDWLDQNVCDCGKRHTCGKIQREKELGQLYRALARIPNEKKQP